MSVSDPLIKDIKECTLQIFNESTTKKITDSSRNLQNLCQAIETIFYQGLIHNQNFFGYKKNGPYSWMSFLHTETSDLNEFNYRNSIEEVEKCKNVSTLLGKFRLLIRHCLVKNCLHFPLQFLNNSNKSKIFYQKNSVLGDEILSAILLSVFLQCDKIHFDLELSSCYFLDLTWQIPNLVKVELVPCKNLGISVSFSENKAVIVHIMPDSVASECGEISTGDVLANLNGVEINSACKGRLSTILRLCKGRPVSVTVIKAFHKHSEDIFLPMKNILRNLQIDFRVSAVRLNSSEEHDSDESELSIVQNSKIGYKGVFLGTTDVGNNGSVKQIAEAIKRCITSNHGSKNPVAFLIDEMSIRIFDLKTNALLFSHSYTQISSCGSAPTLPNYIAYIAEYTFGKIDKGMFVSKELFRYKNCNSLSNFLCYVFYIKEIEHADAILRSIGQGFYRTHFAV